MEKQVRIAEPNPTKQPSFKLEKIPDYPLTWQLMFVVFSVSFGAWFPIGYAYSITTPIEGIITGFVRSVRCRILRLDPKLIFPAQNSSFNFTGASTNDLWCAEIPAWQEGRMLDLLPELNTIWATIGSAIPAGAFISLWTTSFWLARFGCKRTLLCNTGLAVLGTVISGFCVICHSWVMLVVGRLVLGFSVGIAVSVVPLFCTEISPPNLRGAMGTVPGVMMVTGQLVAIVLGLPPFLGTTTLWPIVSFLLLIPASVLLTTLPFCPESPRYLLLRQHDEIASRKALIWLRGTKDIHIELNHLEKEREIEQQYKATGDHVIGIFGLFRDPFLRKVLAVCLAAMLTAQLSGFGAVTMYTTTIFTEAGLGRTASLYCTVGVFALQILAVILSMMLMDRAGRRVLLLAGFIGSAGCCFGILTFSLLASHGQAWAVWANLTCVLAFILVFNVGPAFVPWILVGEMFTMRAQGSAMTLVSASCHFALFVCTFLFPILQWCIGSWVYMIFGGILVLGMVYIFFNLLETKEKELDEIQTELRSKFNKDI